MGAMMFLRRRAECLRRLLARPLPRGPGDGPMSRQDDMDAASAAALLRTLPPRAQGDQKYLWALRQDGRLVGVLDVVRCWPHRHTLTIGLLMIDHGLQRCGLGSAALQALEQRSCAWRGIRRWRVAVVGSQAGALAFWRRAGFVDTGQRREVPGQAAPQWVFEKIVAH
jgi:GNAT superfamily N-acetyltransferase